MRRTDRNRNIYKTREKTELNKNKLLYGRML